MRSIPTVLFFYLLITSCSSNEIANSKDVNADKIYVKYTIDYIEGNALTKIKAQFRFSGYRGTTLVLNEPAAILLDDKPLTSKSDYFNGAYYTASPEVEDLKGEHQFLFVAGNGKKYTEKFLFAPFEMNNPNLDKISKKTDLTLSYAGLQDGDIISVTIKDTSDATPDFVQPEIVKTGQITIAAKDLQLLKAGPIFIKSEKREMRELKQITESGGNIEITYLLKEREVVLRED